MRTAVIMAGGAGLRLWPLSRAGRPKQVLKLFGKESLLRLAYERVAAVHDPEAIYIIAGRSHLPVISQEVPEVPKENLIGEPVGRDTANAVALSAAVLNRRHPDSTMGVFTADHLIRPIDKFSAAVERAYAAAESMPDSLFTLGVTPTSPSTAFGYIERGDEVTEGVFRVARFVEKPSLMGAKEFFDSGKYNWNSGMFVWRTAAILDRIERFLPATYKTISHIVNAWDTPERDQRLEEGFTGLQKISIDYAVMERDDRTLMVELDSEWADVGSWTALANVLVGDTAGNVNAASSVLHLGSKGNIVVAEQEDHLIATIGVQDLVIVHSDDVTLVCSKRDAQGLKELVRRVESMFGNRYL